MIKAEFSGNLFKRCLNRFLVKIGCRPTELDTWEPLRWAAWRMLDC